MANNTSFYPNAITDLELNKARENGQIVTPPEESFNTEAMQGSIQQLLADNLGIYVVCEFLVGTTILTKKEGVLFSVGRSYVTLYQEDERTFITCDIFSIKFITFYLPGHRPTREESSDEDGEGGSGSSTTSTTSSSSGGSTNVTNVTNVTNHNGGRGGSGSRSGR